MKKVLRFLLCLIFFLCLTGLAGTLRAPSYAEEITEKIYTARPSRDGTLHVEGSLCVPHPANRYSCAASPPMDSPGFLAGHENPIIKKPGEEWKSVNIHHDLPVESIPDLGYENSSYTKGKGEIVTCVYEQLKTYMGENEQFDDITMLCFRMGSDTKMHELNLK